MLDFNFLGYVGWNGNGPAASHLNLAHDCLRSDGTGAIIDHNSRSSLELSNYATIQIRDELSRLPGVGDVTYLGQRDYSMRLWLDPQKMAARNIAASDVTRAIEQQNTQVAAGQIGQPPVPTGQATPVPPSPQ